MVKIKQFLVVIIRWLKKNSFWWLLVWCRVVAKKSVCRLAEKLSRLKKARSAFCSRRSRRRGRYGRGSPPPIRGVWGASPGNFENFNSIWSSLVKSRDSFMQKERTIKEKVRCGAAV